MGQDKYTTDKKWSSGSNTTRSDVKAVNDWWEMTDTTKSNKVLTKPSVLDYIKGYKAMKGSYLNQQYGNAGLELAEKYGSVAPAEWEAGGSVPEWLKTIATPDSLATLTKDYEASSGMHEAVKQNLSQDAGATSATELGKAGASAGEVAGPSAGVGDVGASILEGGKAVASSPITWIIMALLGLGKSASTKGSWAYKQNEKHLKPFWDKISPTNWIEDD